MRNNISFKNFMGNLSSHKSELLVCGVFEGEKIDTILDKIVNNSLSKAVKTDSFKGKYKKNIFIYGENVKRVLLLGLGKKKDYSSDRVREIGAIISSYANTSAVKSLSVYNKSFNLSNSKYSQSLTEGLILGNYQFLDYKTVDVKPYSLSQVIFIGKQQIY